LFVHGSGVRLKPKMGREGPYKGRRTVREGSKPGFARNTANVFNTNQGQEEDQCGGVSESGKPDLTVKTKTSKTRNRELSASITQRLPKEDAPR